MKRLTIILLTLIPAAGVAQSSNVVEIPSGDTATVTILPYAISEEGDTLPFVQYEAIDVEQMRRSLRLEARVRKVYPYCMIAVAIMDQMEGDMATLTTDRAKNQYVRASAKLLKVEFEDELKNLSVQQGKVLMKLIHRESGITTYELVKKFKGGLTATFWQGAAKIYGSSMKQEYDPEGADWEIEKYMQQIENGELQPYARTPKTDAGKKALAKYEKRKKKKAPEFDYTPMSQATEPEDK